MGQDDRNRVYGSRALASHECAGVPQLYLAEAAGDKRLRLLGFEGVVLKSGE